MSCSVRTAHHRSWYMVRHVSVCLSFKRILAMFLKCFPQITDQIGLQVFHPSHLHGAVLHMDQPLRSEKTAQNSFWELQDAMKTQQNIPG